MRIDEADLPRDPKQVPHGCRHLGCTTLQMDLAGREDQGCAVAAAVVEQHVLMLAWVFTRDDAVERAVRGLLVLRILQPGKPRRVRSPGPNEAVLFVAQ